MNNPDLQSLCLLPTSGLYVYDSLPGDSGRFVLCSDLGTACLDRSCDCRNSTASVVGNSTVDITVCVDDDLPCSGSQTVNCSSASASASATRSDPTSRNSNNGNIPAPTGSASINNEATSSKPESSSSSTASSSNASSSQTPTPTSSTIVSNSSASSDIDTAGAGSSSSVNTPVIVVVVIASLVFLALLLWFIRNCCQKKIAKVESDSSAPSPTNSPGESSPTPTSFPAFQHRTRNDPPDVRKAGIQLDTDIPYQARINRATNVNHGKGAPQIHVEVQPVSSRTSRSATSTATTVAAAERHRSILPLENDRLQQRSSTASSRSPSSVDSNDGSDLLALSGSTDESYYHQQSSGRLSLWRDEGNDFEYPSDRASTRRSSLNRSTEASIVSFLTVDSESASEDNIYRRTDV